MDTTTASSAQGRLDLSDARYPDPPVYDHVIEDVLLRRWETRADPPRLGPSLRRAREIHVHGGIQSLDDALIDVAVAALGTLTKIRHAVPALIGRRR